MSIRVFLLLAVVCTFGCLLQHAQVRGEEPCCQSGCECEFQTLRRLSELETQLKEQQKSIEALRKRDEVAFSAFRTQDATGFGNYVTIVFDSVLTNIGGAYNGKSGIFTSKQSGVYVFHWVITNKDITYMESQLVLNSEELCRAFSDSGNHNDYTSASNMAVVELKAGDQVWVSSTTWHNGQFGGVKRSSFSGWLLYAH